MPYPPPPGPPAVGEFQAIGKLPAPQLPDVTGHGGDFLETDGIIPQWEPVSGVLPDPTGHAGEFLTTPDGVTVSWAPGGGGGGVTTVGSLVAPTADAATIVGTVLALAPADATNPGVVSIGTQKVSGEKQFQDGAVVDSSDVRNWGVVANDSTSDVAQAFYDILAAATQSSDAFVLASPVGGVAFGPGIWRTSMPLCVPPSTEIHGVSRMLSFVQSGDALQTAAPGVVKDFAGPVFYIATPFTASFPAGGQLPTYGPPLVGASGQSYPIPDLRLLDASAYSHGSLFLHDSWPWAVWMGNTITLTNLSVELWFKPTEAVPVAGTLLGIIGSRGPEVYRTSLQEDSADMAFGIWVTSDGANIQFKAYLTTNPAWTLGFEMKNTGTKHKITSGNVTVGSIYHLEIDYDGSHFDFYVNGVNQGHVVATGPVIRNPWEATSIGAQGVLDFLGVAQYRGYVGYVDSVRLSKVARHTGTSSFTPPSSKYTWDANTLALYNWDQPSTTVQPKNQDGSDNGPVLTLPFIIGQVANASGQGPILHYMHSGSGRSNSQDFVIRDLCVQGKNSNTGIYNFSGYRGTWKNLWVTGCSDAAIVSTSTSAFYNRFYNITADMTAGTGIRYYGTLEKLNSLGCGIAAWMFANCTLENGNLQPAFNGFALVLVGTPAGASTFASISNTTGDPESWSFTRMITLLGAFGPDPQVITTNCVWLCGGTTPCAPIRYFTAPFKSSHTRDTIAPNYADARTGASPCMIQVDMAPREKLLLNICNLQQNPVFPVSECNVDGFLAKWGPDTITNFAGISIADAPTENFAGQVVISPGFTSGNVFFETPEADTNYQLTFGLDSFNGTSPASGSTRISFPIIKEQTGFTISVEADPVTAEVVFNYNLTRKQPPPLYFSYLPTIPSTVANPLAGRTMKQPWGFGVTLTPVSGSTFLCDTTQPAETIVEFGETIESSDWLEMYKGASYGLMALDIQLGELGLVQAEVTDGRLLSFLSPGSHNVAFYYDGDFIYFYLDGGQVMQAVHPGFSDPQPANIHIGERNGGTRSLTTAVLHNLKVDTVKSRLLSAASGIGPGLQPQAALFGDDWTFGFSSTGGTGPWSAQLANARYGTMYYHMAVIQGGAIISNGITTQIADLWSRWQGTGTGPALTSVCIMGGFVDIFGGKTGAETFDGIKQLLEGAPATTTWVPPTSTTSPSDQRAWGIFGVQITNATAAYTVDGNTVSVPWAGSRSLTTDAVVAALNAVPAVFAAFLVYPQNGFPGQDPAHTTVVVQDRTPGTIGNSIVISVDGAGGTICYGNIGGGIPGNDLSVTMVGGQDCVAIINGVHFVTNFDTDVDTTINNFIAAIAADVTIGALVTGTLDAVNHKMILTANNNGAAGNGITLSGSPINTPGVTIAWAPNPSHLVGGFNGAIQNSVPNIILCTIPPVGTNGAVTPTMKTEVNNLNTLIRAYTGAGVTIADVNATVYDAGNHDNCDPTFDAGNGYWNNAGQTAVFGLLGPLLP